MTTFGFRWYGPEDAVTLEHIRQIPPVTVNLFYLKMILIKVL